jgi:hypothetical protein
MQGTFYARPMTLNDWSAFAVYFGDEKKKKDIDLCALGELLLKKLVCTESEVTTIPALTDSVYTSLNAAEISALVEAVAQACRVHPLSEGASLEGLGSAVYDQTGTSMRLLNEKFSETKTILERNFGDLSMHAKSALSESMRGFAEISESLRKSSLVSAALEAQQLRNEVLKSFSAEAAALKTVSESARAGMESSSLLQTMGADALNPHQQRATFAQPKIVSHYAPKLELPRLEETPLGRTAIAGEEAAKKLQELAGLTGQMTNQIGQLHALFLTEVVPQWANNLKVGSAATNTSIQLARRAIYWFIGVTVLMTAWQIWIASEYKTESDKQQSTSAQLLGEQLAEYQRLNQRLTEDAEELRKTLARLEPVLVANPKRESKEKFSRPN